MLYNEETTYNHMKHAIILHGGPSKKEYYDPESPSMSNAHWIPWLQAQLLKKDIAAYTPEVPNSYDRNWATWIHEVERFEIGPHTILVGHSTGAGFFMKYLCTHPDLIVNKVVLVAPWIDPERKYTKNFFDDFTFDPQLVNRTKGITIFNSDNDEDSVHHSVSIIRKHTHGISYKTFHGYGHFTFNDMHTTKFPELLDQLVS